MFGKAKKATAPNHFQSSGACNISSRAFSPQNTSANLSMHHGASRVTYGGSTSRSNCQNQNSQSNHINKHLNNHQQSHLTLDTHSQHFHPSQTSSALYLNAKTTGVKQQFPQSCKNASQGFKKGSSRIGAMSVRGRGAQTTISHDSISVEDQIMKPSDAGNGLATQRQSYVQFSDDPNYDVVQTGIRSRSGEMQLPKNNLPKQTVNAITGLKYNSGQHQRKQNHNIALNSSCLSLSDILTSPQRPLDYNVGKEFIAKSEVFMIVKQLVDHYDQKIDALERQIIMMQKTGSFEANNLSVENYGKNFMSQGSTLQSTQNNSSHINIQSAEQCKRVKNSSKLNKQQNSLLGGLSSAQSKKSKEVCSKLQFSSDQQAQYPIEVGHQKHENNCSPLLLDIEQQLGLTIESPKVPIMNDITSKEQKTIKNGSTNRSQKENINKSKNTAQFGNSKENIQPLVKLQTGFQMNKPVSYQNLTGLPKPKKKKSLTTNNGSQQAIQRLEKEISKVNTNLSQAHSLLNTSSGHQVPNLNICTSQNRTQPLHKNESKSQRRAQNNQNAQAIYLNQNKSQPCLDQGNTSSKQDPIQHMQNQNIYQSQANLLRKDNSNDIIDINASMQKQVIQQQQMQKSSSGKNMAGLLTNFEGLTQAGLETLMAFQTSSQNTIATSQTQRSELTEENEQKINNDLKQVHSSKKSTSGNQTTCKALSLYNLHTASSQLKRQKDVSQPNVNSVPQKSRKKSVNNLTSLNSGRNTTSRKLADSISQTSVLTQKRLLNNSTLSNQTVIQQQNISRLAKDKDQNSHIFQTYQQPPLTQRHHAMDTLHFSDADSTENPIQSSASCQNLAHAKDMEQAPLCNNIGQTKQRIDSYDLLMHQMMTLTNKPAENCQYQSFNNNPTTYQLQQQQYCYNNIDDEMNDCNDLNEEEYATVSSNQKDNLNQDHDYDRDHQQEDTIQKQKDKHEFLRRSVSESKITKQMPEQDIAKFMVNLSDLDNSDGFANAMPNLPQTARDQPIHQVSPVRQADITIGAGLRAKNRGRESDLSFG